MHSIDVKKMIENNLFPVLLSAALSGMRGVTIAAAARVRGLNFHRIFSSHQISSKLCLCVSVIIMQ